jgi:competence CoiA-like predicted nuclease
VVEFQHSSMTLDEFTQRNDFYTSLGYRVVWVFDTCKAFDNKKLDSIRIYYDGFPIIWNRKWKEIFVNEVNNQSKVEIYLQLCTDAIDNLKLQKIIKLKEELTDIHPELFGSSLYEEEREYFDEHQKDKIKLIKLKNSYSPNYLIFDKNSLCDEETFLHRITN